MNTSYVYVTLLSSRNYLKGLVVLAQSLRNVNSKFPLVVLMTSEFIKDNKTVIETLEKTGIKYDVLEAKFSLPDSAAREISSKRWINTFDKLQVFGVVQFKKIVFLDCDMLVVKNIDDLFEEPHLSFAAASEQVSGYENWDMPNTGMMVIEPQENIPEKIFRTWPEVQSRKKDFSDQDLIHHYYRERLKRNNKWRVPAINNAFVFLLDKIIKEKGYNLNLQDPDDKTIAVLHFAIKDRPWLMNTKDIFLFYLDRVINRKFQEIRAYRLYFRELSKTKV